MSGRTDELRGYLWEERARKERNEVAKFLPIFAAILSGIVGLICFSMVEGIVFGIKGSLIMMASVFIFGKVVFWLAAQLGLDQDASFCLNYDGISTTARRKKHEQRFTWNEVVEVSEIIAIIPKDRFSSWKISYIVLSKKPLRELQLLIAADAEHAAEQYTYLYRHPELIAIPKTEEAVSYIERFHKIKPLPEKYRI